MIIWLILTGIVAPDFGVYYTRLLEKIQEEKATKRHLSTLRQTQCRQKTQKNLTSGVYLNRTRSDYSGSYDICHN